MTAAELGPEPSSPGPLSHLSLSSHPLRPFFPSSSSMSPPLDSLPQASVLSPRSHGRFQTAGHFQPDSSVPPSHPAAPSPPVPMPEAPWHSRDLRATESGALHSRSLSVSTCPVTLGSSLLSEPQFLPCERIESDNMTPGCLHP